MAEFQYHLKYKTRGNSTPQGKPKVYFCCHPDDFEFFFPNISDEILGKQNCSVWYADDVNAPRDADFLDELLQMQLFVMPVTSRLMYTKNHAIDIEFRFAIEHRIPVIPIMQESGLEAIFNEKCGNLHFLDKSAYDVTAIPYEQKLEECLSSVLIGDEFAKKVRDAFIAYIFLSYRKKDRKYAQKLMRLIHKNEFCREIAIWYDEFLTPGENFNDAIKQALEKSDFFVMAVTPNLVAEENYIMTTEYPMAQEAGKPIIPAEMVKTDHGALFEKYQQLPMPTDVQNEAALNEILLSAIQDLALKESDDSPEHNFFIGLAYLDGIDVEVDHQRALALISSAAEAGLREAIEKLIHMYKNGKGVERNYETAVAWREKLIICSEKEYRRSPEEGTLNALFWDVVMCGEDYYSLGKVRFAREKYEYAKQLIESSGLQDTSNTVLRNLSVCYSQLGGVCQGEKKYTESKYYFEKSLAICEKLFRETGTVQARHDLAVAYRIMGIPGRAGENAFHYREKAIAMAEELVRETGSLSSRQLLFDTYMFHGAMLKISKQKNLPAARSYYEKALVIAEELLQEFGTPQTRRNLSVVYGLLASISKTLDDTDTMWSYYEKEFSITEALARETDAVQDWRKLASNYLIRAIEYEKAEDIPKAISYCEKSIEIREKLVSATDGVEYIEELYRAYDSLGNIYEKAGELHSAGVCYQEKIAVCEKWAHRTQEFTAYDELARAYCRLGEVTLDKANFEQALDIYRMLCEKFPNQIEYNKRRCDSIQTAIDQLNSRE